MQFVLKNFLQTLNIIPKVIANTTDLRFIANKLFLHYYPTTWLLNSYSISIQKLQVFTFFLVEENENKKP